MLQLTEDLLDVICDPLPEEPPKPRGRILKAGCRQAIAGIFWILDNGAKCEDLPGEFGTKSSVHRAFNRWVEMSDSGQLLAVLGQIVEQRDRFQLYDWIVDRTFFKTKGECGGGGGTKAGEGVRVIFMVDAKSLPITVNTDRAGPQRAPCPSFCSTSW